MLKLFTDRGYALISLIFVDYCKKMDFTMRNSRIHNNYNINMKRID
jgi:hypothetical protein